MKNRLQLNIIIDLAMFLAMVVTSISGIMIKIIAPLRRHATEDWVRELAEGLMLGVGRRWWAEIHLWGGIVLIALLVVHVVLHWKVVDGYFKKHIASKGLRTTLYVVLLVLLLIMTIPWIFIV